jgi:hypothetical protein
MYLEMATEEDKKMTENWKADADGILIFVRRYLLENVRLIHNDSMAVDWSILRCCCIVDLSVNSGPSAKPTGHFQFLPCEYLSGYDQPKYTQYFEFSSCFPSLKVTHSRYSPHKRARIRAFFAEGVEKCLLPWVVETLPTLLHISLFLFFAGLVVFLWNVNLTIFKLVLSWVAICTALYGCITFFFFFGTHFILEYKPMAKPSRSSEPLHL